MYSRQEYPDAQDNLKKTNSAENARAQSRVVVSDDFFTKLGESLLTIKNLPLVGTHAPPACTSDRSSHASRPAILIHRLHAHTLARTPPPSASAAAA